jgi:hypothetical protein
MASAIVVTTGTEVSARRVADTVSPRVVVNVAGVGLHLTMQELHELTNVCSDVLHTWFENGGTL